jgi:ATP dependent DNA ligase domain
MLSRGGPLPRGRGWAYEVKWDGYRAIVSTVDGLKIQSRRRWNMTELVPELASLPEGQVLDGELVAWGDDGLPSFPRLCERMLHRRSGVPVTYVVFDVLEVAGLSTMLQPYSERRGILEALDLDKPARHVHAALLGVLVRLLRQLDRLLVGLGAAAAAAETKGQDQDRGGRSTVDRQHILPLRLLPSSHCPVHGRRRPEPPSRARSRGR